jgi:hypothetical protein
MNTMDRLRVCARLLLLTATIPLATACSLTSADPPSSAHYKVTSDKPVMLITSQQFTVSNGSVSLYTADTVTTSSKDITISLAQPPLFFIRAIPLSATSNVAMTVDIGDKNWYNTTRVISPPDKLEFTYGYSSSF